MKKDNNTTPKKKRTGKVLLSVLGVTCSVVLVLGIVIGTIGSKNVKAMNGCVDAVLAKLEENYTITPVDVGEYEEIKVYGIMSFDVEQYDIKDLGNLSVMRMNMGVMQMSTMVFTPQDKNLPLFSTDFIYMLSNRKSYFEFYDLVKEKDDTYMELIANLHDVQVKYGHLENFDVEPTWYAPLLSVASYKGGTSENDADTLAMTLDLLDVYLTHNAQLPLLTEAEKAEKMDITVAYTDGLIEKGGISTDVFKQELGNEVTKHFFDNVFFGTITKVK